MKDVVAFVRQENEITLKISEDYPRSAEILKLNRGFQKTYEDAPKISVKFSEDNPTISQHFPRMSEPVAEIQKIKCVFNNTNHVQLSDLFLSTYE